MKTRVCIVPACSHEHDDTWLHLQPERRTPVTAHLFWLRQEAAA